MKAVFVHDHKFRRIGNNLYSPGGLANEILQRYVSVFENLSVIGRIIDENQANITYSKIDLEHISIKTVESLESEISNADAVIVRLPSVRGLKAVRLARKMNKPYLVEVVGCALDSYWNYSLKGKLVAFPAYFLARLAVKGATHAVYVTKEFLQSRYPNKNKCCAISDVSLQPTDLAVLDNRLNKIDNMGGKLVLGTAGAVDVTYKGQEFVIRAIPEIEKRLGVTVEYRLAGSGDTARLIAVAKECGVESRIRFEGIISHNLIFEWLDNLDIYIQSGTVEGLSRALLEAMSRGLPCVATKVGGNPELVNENYLVSKSNRKKIPSIMADRICNICAADAMKNQATNNFNKANNEYDRVELDKKRASFYTDFRDSMIVKKV